MVNSEEPGKEKEGFGPDEAKYFVELLVGHEVKQNRAEGVASFIARTGSAKVFDDPVELSEKLDRYSKEIAPYKRRRVLEDWFSGRNIAIPEGLLEKVELSSKEKAKEQAEDEKAKKISEGTVWTVDVDDKGMPKIRMIKGTDEPGTTLELATKAAKQIGKDYGGEEALIVYNESLGRHMPNFKSEFVKRNMGVAWAAARQMDKSVAEGEPVDPMDTFLEQMAKIESMKELVGVKTKESERGGTLGEVVSAVKDLKEMAGEKTQLPEWMRDPVAFQRTIKELSPKGEGEGLKELREEITGLREDQHQAEIKRRDDQIGELGNAIKGYRNEVERLRDDLEKSRQITGRTAYDLLGDLVKKVPDREDIRQMVMETVGKVPKLLTRGTKEREQVLEGMATGIEEAAEIKAIEDDWFGFK